MRSSTGGGPKERRTGVGGGAGWRAKRRAERETGAGAGAGVGRGTGLGTGWRASSRAERETGAGAGVGAGAGARARAGIEGATGSASRAARRTRKRGAGRGAGAAAAGGTERVAWTEEAAAWEEQRVDRWRRVDCWNRGAAGIGPGRGVKKRVDGAGAGGQRGKPRRDRRVVSAKEWTPGWVVIAGLKERQGAGANPRLIASREDKGATGCVDRGARPLARREAAPRGTVKYRGIKTDPSGRGKKRRKARVVKLGNVDTKDATNPSERALGRKEKKKSSNGRWGMGGFI